MREQAREDHRIGAVVDHHLVEAEQFRLLGYIPRDRRDRIAFLLRPLGAKPGVNLQHEFVEMDPALGLVGDGLEGQVHQHRLAAPHPAPQIGAAGRLARPAREPPDDAAPARDFGEPGRQRVERRDRALLVRIGLELAGGDQRPVALGDRGHALREALRKRAGEGGDDLLLLHDAALEEGEILRLAQQLDLGVERQARSGRGRGNGRGNRA